MIDLITALQESVFAMLKTNLPTPYQSIVYGHVPENTQPPMIQLGDIDSENEGTKDDQFEKLTIEIQCIARGQSRKTLTEMIGAVELALAHQTPVASGAGFTEMRFHSGRVGSVMPDGVTYVGIINFETHGWPV